MIYNFTKNLLAEAGGTYVSIMTAKMFIFIITKKIKKNVHMAVFVK